MFGHDLMEKIMSPEERRHFKQDEIVKAPLEPPEPGSGDRAVAQAGELVEWRVTSVAKDGLVNIIRQPTIEEQKLMGTARPNVMMARACRVEDLAKWN